VKTARLRLAGKIVFAAAYVLVAGELFMRILAPQAMLPRYVCATDYGIRGNEPDRSYWHTTPDYRLNIRTNAKGIRAHGEIPYEKPEGVKRIVLLGDSFGMGYGVDLEDTFSSRMVASLEDVGVRCELVNLSVSGFGTAEQLIALEEEGFRYKPDIVLVAWHRTDLEDNIRSNLYALEQGHLSRKSRVYLPAVTTRERLFRFAAYRWLAGSCHLYCCVRERAARLAKFQVIPTIQRLTQIRRKLAFQRDSAESSFAQRSRPDKWRIRHRHSCISTILSKTSVGTKARSFTGRSHMDISPPWGAGLWAQVWPNTYVSTHCWNAAAPCELEIQVRAAR